MLKLLLALAVLLLVGGVTIVTAAYLRFTAQIGSDVTGLLAAAARAPGPIVTEAMLAALPAPAQRYFTRAGVVGKSIPRTIRLTQKGRIRSSADAGWMALEAEEVYSVTPPALVWRTWMPSAALPIAFGRDAYLDGNGSILIKLLALFPVADEHGDELRAAGLMRFLNEMAWFPAAYLGSNVSIAPVDDSAFTVTIADRGLTATSTLFVDAEGKLVNFRARRFNTSTRSTETWETPMTAWDSFEGLNLPTAGSAVWKLPTGDLDYIELEITGIAYDEGLTK